MTAPRTQIELVRLSTLLRPHAVLTRRTLPAAGAPAAVKLENLFAKLCIQQPARKFLSKFAKATV
jgi:hypothetical protein